MIMSLIIWKVTKFFKIVMTSSEIHVLAKEHVSQLMSIQWNDYQEIENEIDNISIDLNVCSRNEKKQFIDRWGIPLKILIEKKDEVLIVQVVSAGPDQLFFTDDDIDAQYKVSLKEHGAVGTFAESINNVSQ